MDTAGRQRPGLVQGLAAWLGMYLVANVVVVLVMYLTGRSNVDQSQVPIWATAVAVSAMWAVFLFAVPRYLPYEDQSLRESSRQWFSTRSVAIGIPLGVASQ